MKKLIYASNMPLDGCTEDERGASDWAPLDDDVFAFITRIMRSADTYLYGRRMYETPAAPPTANTRLERVRDRHDGGPEWKPRVQDLSAT